MTLRQLPVLVSPEEYKVITQAMMLMKRQWQDLGVTDGELLSAVCRVFLTARGVQVEKPSEED